MGMLGKLAKNAEWVNEGVIERKLFVQLMLRGEVLSLSMHFIVASFAVAVATVLWLSVYSQPQKRHCSDTSSADVQATAEAGRRLATRAALLTAFFTILQLPIGIWVLVTLPASSRQAMMGSDWLASLYFMGGIATVIVLLQQLMAICWGDFNRSTAWRTVGLLGVVVLLMTATLRG